METPKKCCVKGCTNKPAKGRKTCGQHGRRNSNQPIKLKTIHVDRVLNTLRDYAADSPVTPVTVSPLPTETPYIAGVAIRDNGSILGLPTTREGFKALLADWLNRPGRSLADIELLTPGHLPKHDLSLAICNSAARLVAHDLGLAVRA